jgi:hypothetical protein
MTNTGLLLAVLFVGLYAALRFVRRPQFRWTFLSATLVAMLVYVAHLTIGAVAWLLALNHDPQGGEGYSIAFAGWFALGVLDLIRTVPRNREPPAFLMKRGLADVLCLIVIVVGLALAWH